MQQRGSRVSRLHPHRQRPLRARARGAATDSAQRTLQPIDYATANCRPLQVPGQEASNQLQPGGRHALRHHLACTLDSREREAALEVGQEAGNLEVAARQHTGCVWGGWVGAGAVG